MMRGQVFFFNLKVISQRKMGTAALDLLIRDIFLRIIEMLALKDRTQLLLWKNDGDYYCLYD